MKIMKINLHSKMNLQDMILMSNSKNRKTTFTETNYPRRQSQNF